MDSNLIINRIVNILTEHIEDEGSETRVWVCRCNLNENDTILCGTETAEDYDHKMPLTEGEVINLIKCLVSQQIFLYGEVYLFTSGDNGFISFDNPNNDNKHCYEPEIPGLLINWD